MQVFVHQLWLNKKKKQEANILFLSPTAGKEKAMSYSRVGNERLDLGHENTGTLGKMDE